jgi:hypothetical protein
MLQVTTNQSVDVAAHAAMMLVILKLKQVAITPSAPVLLVQVSIQQYSV